MDRTDSLWHTGSLWAEWDRLLGESTLDTCGDLHNLNEQVRHWLETRNEPAKVRRLYTRVMDIAIRLLTEDVVTRDG